MTFYLKEENVRTLKTAEKPYHWVQKAGSWPTFAAINVLCFQTNFINKILDDKILKFLHNRSSVFQMLPSRLKSKFIAYLNLTWGGFRFENVLRCKTILHNKRRGSWSRMAANNWLYLKTNFVTTFLDDEILKCLLKTSSVLKMLPSCLKFKIIAYLYFTLGVFPL